MQWECDTQNYVLISFPKILSGSLTLLTITEITTTMIVKVSGKFYSDQIHEKRHAWVFERSRNAAFVTLVWIDFGNCKSRDKSHTK